MTSRPRALIQFLRERPFLADLLSLAGIGVYAVILWGFAQRQFSVLDEGLYLYKGWLFASGRYTPFQAYGPWTNQMPLAFLIPGWVELLFGPGLRTGRIFAVALGMLALIGLWLTSRRIGGRWIAAGVVAAVILNPAAARMYTMAASQGLVACLLAWTMFFSLGSDRKNWQLLVGGLLAGAAVMVRINLLPLLPLLALYVLREGASASHLPGKINLLEKGATHFWMRGQGWLWLLAGILVTFGGVHLVYWPEILQLWAKWLPFPFLKTWFPPKTIPTWNPDNPIGFRIASFFLAFRYHFASLGGALVTWILWPKGNKTKSEKRKIALFLSLLLLTFFYLHAWAALGNEYCVFCFPTYTSFYSGIGLLLVAVTVSDWRLDLPAWRKWLGGLGMLALLAGMAYSAEGTFADLAGETFYKRLLAFPVPGLSAQVWQVVANKFQLEYGIIYSAVHAWFPVAAVVAFGLVTLVVVNQLAGGKSGAGLVVLALVGVLLSPSPLLAGEYNSYDCPADVIPGYEAAGAQLAQVIPAGSSVYWAGYSPVTLLSLPGARIFPAQLHGTYSFRIAADEDALTKYGWWNQSLAEKWLREADFVLVEQRNLNSNDWLAAQLANFERVTTTAPQSCQPDSAMLVFRRK